MRKTLLMLLAVLVCCSSLFVVAGCGPKYVDHPHVGVGECESCGANYYELMRYVITKSDKDGNSLWYNIDEKSKINFTYYKEYNEVTISYNSDDWVFSLSIKEDSDGFYEWYCVNYEDFANDPNAMDRGNVIATMFTSKTYLLSGEKTNIYQKMLNASMLQSLIKWFDVASSEFGFNLTYENLGFTNF